MPISNDHQPPTYWTSPAIGVCLPNSGDGAWVRPGELLVDVALQSIVEGELRGQGGHPYTPGEAARDWRRRTNAPNYGDVNGRLTAAGLGYRLWTGLPVEYACRMAEDPLRPGVHYNTVMVGEDFYQGGGGGFPVAVAGPRSAVEASPDGIADLAVLDSGVPADWQAIHPELKAAIQEVGGPLPSSDPLDEDQDGVLDRQAGHGLFICGLILRLVPTLDIQVVRVLHASGETDDTLVCPALAETSARLINLSFGGYTADNKPSGLLAATVARAAGRGQVIVAAAGNAGGAHTGSPFWNRPFWPAALPGVLAVGAFDSRGDFPEIWFQPGAGEHGEDVGTNAAQVYAPGVKIRSSYLDGWPSPDPNGGAPFTGWAEWTGTSFAAPVVAATLAGAIAADPGTPAPQLAANWLASSDLTDIGWPKPPGAATAARIYHPPTDPTVL